MAATPLDLEASIKPTSISCLLVFEGKEYQLAGLTHAEYDQLKSHISTFRGLRTVIHSGNASMRAVLEQGRAHIYQLLSELQQSQRLVYALDSISLDDGDGAEAESPATPERAAKRAATAPQSARAPSVATVPGYLRALIDAIHVPNV